MNCPFQMFTHPRFGNVRIGILNDAPYFVGKDVAKALITLHEPNQCMKCIKRKMVIINESGVYSLVLSANTPDAQEFKHWVTSEVLPAIFANGSYSLVEPPAEQVAEFKPLAKLADVFNFNPPTKPPAQVAETKKLPDIAPNNLSPETVSRLLEVADKFSNQQLRDKVLIHIANQLCGKNIF